MTVEDRNLAVRFAHARAQAARARDDVDVAWGEAIKSEYLADPADRHQMMLVRAMSLRVGCARVAAAADAGDHALVVERASDLIERSRGETGDEVYHLLNNSLFAQGAEEPIAFHGLELMTRSVPGVGAGDLVCCLVVKNGMWRLADYLESLRSSGVERFFVVDNASDDGTAEYLKAQDDVVVWRTGNQFSTANSGAAWLDVLLRLHAPGSWALILDLDEDIRVADDLPIPEFCRRLDASGFRASSGLHVDLYPRGHNDATLHYDRIVATDHVGIAMYPGRAVVGSAMRQRVFGYEVMSNKAPLQKMQPGLVLCLGQHFSHHRREVVAEQTCAVLHYKFARGFTQRVEQISSDCQHHTTWRAQNAMYARYAATHGESSMFDPHVSVALGATSEMVEQRILAAVPGNGFTARMT